MKNVLLKAACECMKGLMTVKTYEVAMSNLIMPSLHTELILSNRSNELQTHELQTHETLWMNLKES